MSRRNKIIITVIVAAVVLLLVIVFLQWWNARQTVQGPVNTNQGIEIPETLPTASAGLTNGNNSPVEAPDMEAGLKAVALSFAERFGSYSIQGNFSNLDALNDLMTVRMKTWVDNYKAEQETGTAELPYYGISTLGLSTEILTFEEGLGRAEVLVSTQRQETRGNTVNPRIFYQNIKLQLVKTGEEWKVDAAEWQ